MPRKNVKRSDSNLPQHVYNRARRRRRMFIDDRDRDHFTDLIASRLSRITARSGRKPRHPQRFEGVELFAVSLMTTHFHLVVWETQDETLRRLMQSLMTSYVMYYNRRHKTSGPLFNGPYRARPLRSEKQLKYAIAYVHANHDDGPGYKYSSWGAYLDPDKRPGWLNAETPLSYFGGPANYARFMKGHAARAELNGFFFDDNYE